MLGIKTAILNYLRYKVPKKISNDWHIWQLMRHFQADERGHQANTQQADLGYGWIHYGLIRQQKPKKLLCIGSRYGFVPAVMAQACKDNEGGIVDFVDAGYGESDKNHWTGKAYWKTKPGLQCFEKFGLEKNIKIFVKTTQEFAQINKKRTYDYIYIDGDHSYKGASLDYRLFWPKLKKGGFMVFHDVSVTGTLPEGEYGVGKLFNKIKQNQPHLIINFPISGLGILQKN